MLKSKEKLVAICMSTYNGEKYLEEQLQSLINQTYSNIKIYVRDDGSSDKTKEILQRYKDKIIIIAAKENIGVTQSFMRLLNCAEDADYYAFCDQDDVWLPNKIERAIEKLEKGKCQIPTMYFSDYDYYDENMNYISRSAINKNGPSFQNALVECISLGMNMVINRSLRDLLVRNKMQKAMYHDWIIYLIASSIGNIIYDREVTVKYRRHGKNVSTANQNFIQFQIWRIKQIFKKSYFKQVKEQLIEFENIYKENLREEDKKILSLFTKRNYSFVNSMKKVFYPKMFRQKILDDIFIRIIFLVSII